jgi:hypothetical protein
LHRNLAHLVKHLHPLAELLKLFSIQSTRLHLRAPTNRIV